MREVYGASSYEPSSAPNYLGWFDSNAKRVKRPVNGENVNWSTRTANDARYIHILVNGSAGTVATANSNYHVPLGFCT